MPRKAKDKEEIIEEKTKAKKTTSKSKTTTSKKTTTKKSTTSKKVATKKSATTTKKVTTSKKATTTKKTSAAKKSTTKKSTVKKSSSKSKKKAEKPLDVLEYYDLPYRYNQTVVKVLAQTPEILFVYWDISDEDKEKYINQYGEFFFNDTKPVLIVHNDTLNYSFEVDINDFANSWYLHINDSNCDYRVELGRRPINEYARIDNYMHVSSSNEMEAPNDHILFDSLNNNVYFRNVKTNVITKKDISLSFLSRIGKLYNVKDFYKTMFKNEDIDFERLNFKNMPSS